MVGDFGVGKTSSIRRFVEGQFSDKYLSTVGVKISRKMVELSDSKVQLILWDLEGHTKFKAIAPTYLQGAKGALIVADVTRPETIDRISDHLDLFYSVNAGGKTLVALNKCDLIDSDAGEKWCNLVRDRWGDLVLEVDLTSAKTGENVDRLFTLLTSAIA